MTTAVRIPAAGARSSGKVLPWYVVLSAIAISAYPWISPIVQQFAFLMSAVGAAIAVAVGLTAVQPGKRLPWWLLSAALALLVLGLVVRLGSSERAEAVGVLLNAAGNVGILAAAVALIRRCGRADVGGVIDAAIVGLAFGGLLWILVARLGPPDQPPESINLFLVLVTLSGVLGALARVAMVLTQPVAGICWLLVGLGLALTANVVQAASTRPSALVAADMLFMAAYTAVGAFGLHPSAPRLVRPGFAEHEDMLSVRRLAFLGAAVAIVPVAIGVRILVRGGNTEDGVLLTVGGAGITALVMVRIGRLSAHRSRVEQALRHQVAVDPLTGLANRRAFLDRLQVELGRGRPSAVLFCDLDGFKAVNDQWGHGVGDELLAQCADRLASCVRETDIVSRFGGDEFLILLVNVTETAIDAVIERIGVTFADPFRLTTATVTLGVSIGVATATEGDPDRLVRIADSCMYEAKRSQGASPTVRVAA